MVWCALLQFHLPVGRMIRRAERSGWCRGPECDIVVDGRPVGPLDGREPGGHARFAGGDGLAVALAVGAFGQALAESLDLADMGLALVGVRGDGEHDGAGGGGIQDEADGLALGIPAGQGDDPGSVGFWPGLFGLGEALPGPLVEFGQHQVGPVELVAGGAEVLADRAEGGAPAGAVLHEPEGLRPVRVGAGAGVDAQLGLERRGDLAGADEADQAPGEDGGLRPGGLAASRSAAGPGSEWRGGCG